MICSRCGRTLKEYFVTIRQELKLYRFKEDGLVTQVPNTGEPTSEILCEECYVEYADKINELNREFQQKSLINMVEVVDEIQYDTPEISYESCKGPVR